MQFFGAKMTFEIHKLKRSIENIIFRTDSTNYRMNIDLIISLIKQNKVNYSRDHVLAMIYAIDQENNFTDAKEEVLISISSILYGNCPDSLKINWG